MHERLSFLRPETGNVETVVQKIVRHVLTGEIDRDTLKRGVLYVRESFRSESIRKAKVELAAIAIDYCSVEGLTVLRYNLILPSLGKVTLPGAVDFTEFPLDSRLSIITLPKKDYQELNDASGKIKRKQSQALEKYGGIACFVGPTSTYYDSLPNNGYFDKGRVWKPFKDTQPSGQRRGAIAITDTGEVKILEEKEKIEARKRKFKGYKTVSGTSFYIKSSDVEGAVEFLSDVERSQVSYFIIYETISGATGMAHLNVRTLVSRVFIKRLLDQHAANRNWKQYIAAELELANGGAFAKSEDNSIHGNISRSNGYIKRDFYMIERKK